MRFIEKNVYLVLCREFLFHDPHEYAREEHQRSYTHLDYNRNPYVPNDIEVQLPMQHIY